MCDWKKNCLINHALHDIMPVPLHQRPPAEDHCFTVLLCSKIAGVFFWLNVDLCVFSGACRTGVLNKSGI